MMIMVFCLDTDEEFYFVADNGEDAINKMLYTLNVSHKDRNAKIQLINNRTWSLVHGGKTYGCRA